jgi:hypothetical protein
MGDLELENCSQYKYLRVIINEKNNMKDHIEETKRKTEAAYQTIMSITESADFKGIEMQSVWQLVEACIIPTITYGTEAGKMTNSEKHSLNIILDTVIKRILMIPMSTPRGPIYFETGLLDIEHTILKNRINYANKLGKKKLQCTARHH